MTVRRYNQPGRILLWRYYLSCILNENHFFRVYEFIDYKIFWGHFLWSHKSIQSNNWSNAKAFSHFLWISQITVFSVPPLNRILTSPLMLCYLAPNFGELINNFFWLLLSGVIFPFPVLRTCARPDHKLNKNKTQRTQRYLATYF